MNQHNYIQIAQDVLRQEGDELLAAAERVDDAINDAIALITETTGKLVIIGVGKSGLVGQKAAATFSSTGTSSFFVHPTEAMHGDLGMVGDNDSAIVISYSGESQEVKDLMPHLRRRGIKTIALSKSKESSLGQAADVHLSIYVEEEACPINVAPTTSTTLTMALLDALAVCMMKKNNFAEKDFAVFHPGGSLGKRLFVTVKDIMRIHDLPTAYQDASLRDALPIMTSGKLGTVFFVNHKDVVVGILSDGDIRRALEKDDFSIDDGAYAHGSSTIHTVVGDMLVIDAFKKLENHKIQILPVVDSDQKLIGAIHIHDLIELGFA